MPESAWQVKPSGIFSQDNRMGSTHPDRPRRVRPVMCAPAHRGCFRLTRGSRFSTMRSLFPVPSPVFSPGETLSIASDLLANKCGAHTPAIISAY